MRKIYMIIVLIILSSCQSKTKNDIKKYLENDIKISLNNNELYILTPTYDGKCTTIQNQIREFLLTKSGVQKKLHLIYIGNSKKELNFISKGLNEKFDVIYDSKNIAIKKGVIKFQTIVFIPNLEKDIKYELSTYESFKKLKNDVINLDKKH